jgi:hypothetical protein
MISRRSFLSSVAYGSASVAFGDSHDAARWTEKQANFWYAKQPWLVGSNYITSNAINELEMWQPETFDPDRIDRELGWAEQIGMNTMRVFLHDFLWEQDANGFTQRIDKFLQISSSHKISPLFVLFDSCWDPNPKLGSQKSPTPGVHNSGWVQSPGMPALQDSNQYPRLERYVAGVVKAFGKDKRVLGWDIWNEPDNLNKSSYNDPAVKVDFVLKLLPQAFAWARSVSPTQPLTSGIWQGDWSVPERLEPMAKIQLDLSDVISFHNYDPPDSFEKHVSWLQRYNRPLICTEYMARPRGSTFEKILPIEKQYKVGAVNWGFVAGKTQTNLPWDSWQHPYVERPPNVWFHDIFRADGTPYRQEEVQFIREITGRGSGLRKSRSA